MPYVTVGGQLYPIPVSSRILAASESGVMQRWKMKFWPRSQHCPDPRGVRTATPTAVQLQHLYGLMLVVGILLMLASAAMLVENILGRCIGRKKDGSRRNPYTLFTSVVSKWRRLGQVPTL